MKERVVEAVGIPHTEVDLILAGGESVGFSHCRPVSGDRLAVYPRVRDARHRDPSVGSVRHRSAIHGSSSTSTSAGSLGCCGSSASTCGTTAGLDDAALAAICADEHRILLTRDRGLLKRRQVTHGLFVRADQPVDQIVEVLRRLDLAGRLAPFTRCLRCGDWLVAVRKSDVLDRLQPLTRRHVDDFARCRGCGQLYWEGVSTMTA